jgi:hypothetical protein
VDRNNTSRAVKDELATDRQIAYVISVLERGPITRRDIGRIIAILDDRPCKHSDGLDLDHIWQEVNDTRNQK